MKLIYILALALIMINCASEAKEQKDNSKTENDSISEVDTVNIIVDVDSSVIEKDSIVPPVQMTDSDKKSLKKYLSSAEVKKLDAALNSLNNSEIDSVIINSFLSILQITDSLKYQVIQKSDYEAVDENGDYYPFNLQSELAGLEKSIPGFTNSCVAECTEYDCRFELGPYVQRAKETTGQADDEFFKLLILANGEYMTTAHQFRAWFAQFWDYGGASFLGSNIHFEFLQKSQAFLAKHDINSNLLLSLQQEAFGDVQHGIYMNSSVKASKELNDIINLNVFTPEENDQLKQLMIKMVSKDFFCENCVSQKLQFDCETGNCDFGG